MAEASNAEIVNTEGLLLLTLIRAPEVSVTTETSFVKGVLIAVVVWYVMETTQWTVSHQPYYGGLSSFQIY